MRRPFTIAFLSLLAGLLAFFVWQAGSRGHKPSITLPDGTILTFEAVTVGTNHVFESESRLRSRIRNRLPLWLDRFLGPRAYRSIMLFDHDSAFLWFTRFDPNEGLYLRSEVENIRVVDTDGQVFSMSHVGSQGNEAFWETHIELDFVPRRSKTFKVLFGFQGRENFSVQMENPVHARVYPQWSPHALPQDYSTNGFRFELVNLTAHADAGNRYHCRPIVRVTRDGRDCSAWWTPTYEFSDATGNTRSQGLSFTEPAWRLSVRMFPSANYPFTADQIIGLGESGTPQAGESIQLLPTPTLRALGVTTILLTGPGKFRLETGSVVSAQPWEATMRGSSSASSGAGRVWKYNYATAKPRLVLVLDSGSTNAGGLPSYDDAGARLLMRAIDVLDAVVPLRNAGSHGFGAGANSVRVHSYEWNTETLAGMQTWELIPVRATTMEFMVAPPQRPEA